MNASSPTAAPASPHGRLVVGGLIALATVAAYHNTFGAPFVLDDLNSIVTNASLRQLWPVWPVLHPPPASTVTGRPVLNLTFAINHAISGDGVWSYHAINLAIHVLAALTLFGLVRRTLTLPVLRPRFGDSALPLAGTIAALWALHPLQTEAVTYVVQRAESLAGLFYLLTLYAFVRATDPAGSRAWFALSIAACLLGMATKEVMVSAPLVVLAYDFVFLSGGVAGGFRAGWRTRRPYYYALAATWIVLGGLVAGAHGRSGSAGFGTSLSSFNYALTQAQAIGHYLALSFWPRSLVFDYGAPVIRRVADVWLPAGLLVTLVAASSIALARRSAIGFAGLCFFALLAPSSSVVPVASQTMAEHRMYLPLAAVVALTVLGLHAGLGRRSLVVWPAVALALGWLTLERNAAYRTATGLWGDTVAKRPENARAQSNLGSALSGAQRFAEAIPHYEAALRLDPGRVLVANAPVLHNNLGHHLATLGRISEAIPHFQEALRLDPDYALAHQNLGDALAGQGRFSDAEFHYRDVLRLGGGAAGTHADLAATLLRQGRVAEAIPHYREALRLTPLSAPGHNNLAYALLLAGNVAESIAEYREALRLDPRHVAASAGLGYALIQAGRPADAIAPCEEALRLQPDFADAHNSLGIAFAQTGRRPQAVIQFKTALRLDPSLADAHNNLANALSGLGRPAEAIAHYEAAVRLKPDYAEAHQNLAEELAQAGRPAEASMHFELAARLRQEAGVDLARQTGPSADK